MSKRFIWKNVFLALMILSAKACQPPDIPVGGYYTPMLSKYEPGDKIRYNCYKGYMRNGRETRSCKLDGKWTDQTPFCDWPIKLKNPMSTSTSANLEKTIDNDTGTCFRTRSGTGEDFKVYLNYPAIINVIRLFLPKGYVRFDISVVRNGHKKRCTIINRQLEEKQWVVVTCDDTSTSDSIHIHEISDTKKALEICEIEIFVKDSVWCKNPPNVFIPNGWLQISRDKATLQCGSGFNPGENKRLLCDNHENFSGGTLQCEEILCERVIMNTTGGDWQMIGNDRKFSVGTLKRLKCEHGYSVVGSQDTIRCLPNGTWTSSNARCEERKPTGTDSNYKSIIIASSTVISIVIISCFIVFIVLLLKKKSNPVVVVLKRGDELDSAVVYNETEYSTIAYDSISAIPNINPRYPTPPSSRPPVDLVGEYTKPSDQYPPPYQVTPPYTQPESSESVPKTVPNENDLMGSLKSSPVYSAS